MNLVDSSGWLAYFADEPHSQNFLNPLSEPESLVVPTICLYEVFKVILRESSENEALQAIAAMQKGTVVNLTPSLAIAASKYSLTHNLPMADSIILATARIHDATIWTLDSDFKNIKGVKYYSK